jgi:hypothetical protein
MRYSLMPMMRFTASNQPDLAALNWFVISSHGISLVQRRLQRRAASIGKGITVMNTANLIRWSHALLILSGLSAIFSAPQVIGWSLMVLGLIGVHGRQFKKVGWLGHFALGVIVVVSALPAFMHVFTQFLSPLSLTIILGLVEFVGFMLYGIVTLRAKVLPPGVGIFFIAFIFLVLLLANLGTGGCWILIG